MESYRNASGHVCTHILLNVGFIHGLKPEEFRDISRGLTHKYKHQGERKFWEDQMCTYSDVVRQKMDEHRARMIEEQVKLAVGHLILSTIYTPSDLMSMHIISENPGASELPDLAFETVNQRKV